MKYYQFHIGDYAQETGHLDPIEDIAYRRMLDLYYREQAPLTTDVQRIAKLIRMPENSGTVRDILNEFFTESPDGYRNTRADREIEAYKRMADGGAKGAAKRWLKAADAPPIGTGSPPQDNPNANQLPGTNYQEPGTKERKARQAPHDDASFDAFWTLFPNKKAKQDAAKAWAKLKPDTDLQDKITQAIAAQSASDDWRKDNGKFIPHPATWLNGRRWEDLSGPPPSVHGHFGKVI